MTSKNADKKFFPAELIYPPDFLEFAALSPVERLARSADLWDMYLTYGGSLDPDIDPQSPFFAAEAQSSGVINGRPGMRILRRC